MREHRLTKAHLDIPINQIIPEEDNTQTMREFIMETEKEFRLEHKNLDALNDENLTGYIDFLDELWQK